MPSTPPSCGGRLPGAGAPKGRRRRRAALQGFRTLRPGHPQWLELGGRAVSVMSRAQRANDTIAMADRLLATVDDVDTIRRIQTHAVKALWLSGRFVDLIDRAERSLALTTGRRDLTTRFRAAQALA